MPPFLANLLKNTKALVALAVVFVLVVLTIALFGKFNAAQKTMVAKENALGAQYSDCQNNLSSYVSSIKEALGVADRATAALDDVLTDVIRGRYEVGSTAQPANGSAFSAIVEAYPDLTGMTVNYANVQTAIFAGRDGFKNCQTRMLDMIRDYKAWKDSGLIGSQINAMVGAPSDRLEARIGDDVVHGQAALDQMQRIILTADTKQSYNDGEMEPLDLGPSEPQTPEVTAVP